MDKCCTLDDVLTDNWTRDAACIAGIPPPPQSIIIVAKLLLISRPAEGRRSSWPEHTVGWQLAVYDVSGES